MDQTKSTQVQGAEAQPQGVELPLEKRVMLLVDAAVNEHNELSVGSYGELIHGLVKLIEARVASDTNDAELWRYFTAIAIQKGFQSIEDALAKATLPEKIDRQPM